MTKIISSFCLGVVLTTLLWMTLGVHPLVIAVDSTDQIKPPELVSVASVVKAGQIWGYVEENNDPFKYRKGLRKRVLEVKKGYVRWQFADQPWDTKGSSDEAGYFVRFMELKENHQ